MAVDSGAPLPGLGQYVGKTDPDEVLVTRWSPHHDGAHLVIARWPRVHRFYTPTPAAHGPHLFTESVRQALALLARAAFGVPMSHRLSWETYVSTVSPHTLRTRPDATTVELVVVHDTPVRRRLGTVHLSASITAVRGEVRLGTARVRYTAFPPKLYDRLRGRYADAKEACARALPAPPPLPCALVGRSRPGDVVLAAADAPRTWLVRADTSHPVLFDHPHDHVPGMLLLEACTQAAVADAHPWRSTPVGFETTFSRYVELDQPCRITAEDLAPARPGQRRVRLTGRQAGQESFSAVVTGQVTDPVAASRFAPAWA
ncbi:gamma-butyrolactone biosynthesis enzyme [Streptomyces spinoverrucosus]|uniref:ScbA/BarX family gamma-butyrolactone biosynthesis protein n=1 Tax=Streptomyces spinoverrucosus TaxID=284043 RepID=UPI0018C45082|nr:ScbA/BarX family gamma-butyrolactone biosynthesis protein [Streptomyces spinoverrucosus]MBG0855470.1 gamma-butyrolactone biosynthesis enzyme [Streptomyces spinoverrucosus]